MTPAEIAELRRLCEAATPGPYSVRHGRDQASDVYTVLDGNDMWVADCGNAPQDAALIATARTALPAALDEVERLTREREEAMDAMASSRAEARDGFQQRLDAAESAMIQVLDDAISSPSHVEPPSDMSAEFARLVRAVRVNVIMRERAKDAQDRLAADRDRLRALLAEAVGIAGLQDDEVTPEIRERLAALRTALDSYRAKVQR